MEIHPTQQNEVAWSSWLPALGYALGNSHGPVLEIGIGHFSTPFLHEFCKGANRELWSIESDDTWRKNFEGRYAWDTSSDRDPAFHRFGYPMKNPPAIEFQKSVNWGVVFIDDSPGGENRAKHFRSFIDHSEYVVVHDYWRDNEEAIKPLLEGVNYKVFHDYEPPTLLASKIHKL
jgi:hypothetical protein